MTDTFKEKTERLRLEQTNNREWFEQTSNRNRFGQTMKTERFVQKMYFLKGFDFYFVLKAKTVYRYAQIKNMECLFCIFDFVILIFKFHKST